MHHRVGSDFSQRCSDGSGIAHVNAERLGAAGRGLMADRAGDFARRGRRDRVAKVTPESRNEEPHANRLTDAHDGLG